MHWYEQYAKFWILIVGQWTLADGRRELLSHIAWLSWRPATGTESLLLGILTEGKIKQSSKCRIKNYTDTTCKFRKIVYKCCHFERVVPHQYMCLCLWPRCSKGPIIWNSDKFKYYISMKLDPCVGLDTTTMLE